MVISNYDLQSVSKVIGTAPTSFSLGAVPTYMNRYITFIRIENKFGGDQTCYLVSVATDTYASTPARASAVARDRIFLEAGETKEIPQSGPCDPKHPLFSIAGAKYLNALTDQGNVNVFIQYYEE